MNSTSSLSEVKIVRFLIRTSGVLINIIIALMCIRAIPYAQTVTTNASTCRKMKDSCNFDYS